MKSQTNTRERYADEQQSQPQFIIQAPPPIMVQRPKGCSRTRSRSKGNPSYRNDLPANEFGATTQEFIDQENQLKYKGVFKENKNLRDRIKERENQISELSGKMESMIKRALVTDVNEHEVIVRLEKENESLQKQAEDYVRHQLKLSEAAVFGASRDCAEECYFC